jgi:hypothetical protein
MVDDFENTIGYRKPPKASQFQKGRSGNPNGRPRTNPSVAEVVRKVARQVVLTSGPKGQQRMTKLEASITQLLNKAATGDLKAMRLFLQMVSRHLELVTGPDAPILLTIVPAAGFSYNCEFQGLAGTTLPTPEMSELVWCVETLEAYELQGSHTPPYDLDVASEYPASPVTFGGIEIVTNGPGPAGLWTSSDVVTNYGEHTSIITNATVQGEIAISF